MLLLTVVPSRSELRKPTTPSMLYASKPKPVSLAIDADMGLQLQLMSFQEEPPQGLHETHRGPLSSLSTISLSYRNYPHKASSRREQRSNQGPSTTVINLKLQCIQPPLRSRPEVGQSHGDQGSTYEAILKPPYGKEDQEEGTSRRDVGPAH